MKIVLVRHGQTEENFEGNICGLNNEMMNDTGRRQCQRLKEKLKDIDFSKSIISGIAVYLNDLKGAIINEMQAIELTGLLGVKIAD